MNTSFENAVDGKDEWLTPPHIVTALGPFDLDPCSPVNRPWNTAMNHYSKNGLELPWDGYVWCNPPYNELYKWIQKLSEHGNGIAITFARTETKTFFDFVWSKAASVLFLKGRLKFYHVDGTLANNSAGAPSVLIAYGDYASSKLKESKLAGKFIRL